MKQFDYNPESQYYNNYRELILVLGSFITMVLYLRSALPGNDLSMWIVSTVVAAATIINLAIFMVPISKRDEMLPFYPYVKANAFSSLMWLVVSISVGWKTVLVPGWIGITATVLCVITGILMIVVGPLVHLFLRVFTINNIITSDYRQSHHKEPDNRWTGKLPERVDNYVRPRYVYSDGIESETPRPEGGWIIGYRISPTLVIHNMTVDYSYTPEFLSTFITKYGGELLTKEEIKVLKENWSIVSKMRTDIGDTPLPSPYFWYIDNNCLESMHYREDYTESDPQTSAVILKR